MRLRDHASTLRRVALACALVAVALPGNGRGWFGSDASRAPESTLAWGSVVRDVLGPELARRIPTMRPIPAPTSWPEPVVTPTTVPPLAPAPGPEPVIAVETPVPPEPVTAPPARAPRLAPPPAVVARLPTTGVAVYAHAGDAQPASGIAGTTEFGTPRVLLTTLTTTTVTEPWVEVYLPTRPNGSTAWVRTDGVTLQTVDDRITVDLEAHTVTWERNGDVVGVVDAGVGAPRTPTPPGTYFVTDVLPYDRVGASSPNGGYGAWVVALNGYSESIAPLDGQEVRLAIHGTNEPSSIGQSASSGCVRIGAGPLDTLAHNVPIGTPVVIR